MSYHASSLGDTWYTVTATTGVNAGMIAASGSSSRGAAALRADLASQYPASSYAVATFDSVEAKNAAITASVTPAAPFDVSSLIPGFIKGWLTPSAPSTPIQPTPAGGMSKNTKIALGVGGVLVVGVLVWRSR